MTLETVGDDALSPGSSVLIYLDLLHCSLGIALISATTM